MKDLFDSRIGDMNSRGICGPDLNDVRSRCTRNRQHSIGMSCGPTPPTPCPRVTFAGVELRHFLNDGIVNGHDCGTCWEMKRPRQRGMENCWFRSSDIELTAAVIERQATPRRSEVVPSRNPNVIAGGQLRNRTSIIDNMQVEEPGRAKARHLLDQSSEITRNPPRYLRSENRSIINNPGRRSYHLSTSEANIVYLSFETL